MDFGGSARSRVGRRATGDCNSLRDAQRARFLSSQSHVDGCGDEAVRRRRHVDVCGHSGARRHRWRHHRRSFLHWEWRSSRGRACFLRARLLRFSGWPSNSCAPIFPIFAFPWNLIGYAASGNLALVQLTTITGIYGLSFIVAAFGSLLAYAILSGRHRAWQAVLVAAALLILVARGGAYFVPQAAAHHVAHLVQTNFPQSEEYPPDWNRIHAGEMNELETISVDAAKREPGLIVWPEVPAPFSLQDAPFAARAAEIARDSGSDFLVGVVDWKRSSTGTALASNSAVLLDPSGRRVFTYDKIHLVPFGEYVPLRRWLTFAGRLTADISDFTPGSAYSIGELPEGTSSEQKFGDVHLLRGGFPGRCSPLHQWRRRAADQYFERRLVRTLRRSGAALDDGARASRRESPLAPSRHKQWLHGCR